QAPAWGKIRFFPDVRAMSKLIPPELALERVLASLAASGRVEQLPVAEALGRVLAEDQHAAMDVPGWDNSAMDGYALRCADAVGADAVLPLSQTIAAGHPGTPLQPGSVARIFTGAPLPEGADAVVMQEDTEILPEGIRLLEQPRPGQNIRLRGHDVSAGTCILRAGSVLQ